MEADRNNSVGRGNNLLFQRNSDWLAGRASISAENLVLIADDSETDIFFLLRAFAASGVQNSIHVCRNGEETLSYLQGTGKHSNRARFPIPKIVLLDLYMPRPDGFEILEWKGRQPELKETLFIALSNSDRLRDINRAYTLGASTFLSKPLQGEDVANLLAAFDQHWSLRKSAAVFPLAQNRP